jgi:hypothetical protein
MKFSDYYNVPKRQVKTNCFINIRFMNIILFKIRVTST